LSSKTNEADVNLFQFELLETIENKHSFLMTFGLLKGIIRRLKLYFSWNFCNDIVLDVSFSRCSVEDFPMNELLRNSLQTNCFLNHLTLFYQVVVISMFKLHYNQCNKTAVFFIKTKWENLFHPKCLQSLLKSGKKFLSFNRTETWLLSMMYDVLP
jgi:hypothetical protein